MASKRRTLKQRIKAWHARRKQRRLKQQEVEQRRERHSEAELFIYPFGSATHESDAR